MSPASAGSADLGLVGLGVMGRNFSLNMADHGFTVGVYDRHPEVTGAFVKEHPSGVFGERGGGLVPSADLKAFVASIKRPRRIILLIKAGAPTDGVIAALTPLLEAGDCLVDCGNSLWTDTERNEARLRAARLLFMGSGISGGEIGARFGPSLMPGGAPEAWTLMRPIWEAVAAQVDAATGVPIEGARPGKPVEGGVPCTTYIGPGGAGHFVKMVHNGIEYGDMQVIAEAHHFMREALGLDPEAQAAVFAEWNTGDLDSYLIQITADILRQKDPVTGRPFVDMVLDAAGQKGTGKWTTESALDFGIPADTLAEAVFARTMSALKAERVAAAAQLGESSRPASPLPAAEWVPRVRQALYCSKICAYAQGFALMSAADRERKWSLRLGDIASIFRGGCIIRARFLQKITDAYARAPGLTNLLLDPYFAKVIREAQPGWRAIVCEAARRGIPVPAFGSALSYFDAYRSASLPANLIQAQRDYFGSHTYERVDQPRGRFFHVDWPDPRRPQVEAGGH